MSVFFPYYFRCASICAEFRQQSQWLQHQRGRWRLFWMQCARQSEAIQNLLEIQCECTYLPTYIKQSRCKVIERWWQVLVLSASLFISFITLSLLTMWTYKCALVTFYVILFFEQKLPKYSNRFKPNFLLSHLRCVGKDGKVGTIWITNLIIRFWLERSL